MFHWILTHRAARLVIPPLILAAVVASLAAPLLSDLHQVDDDDLVIVQHGSMTGHHDGNLIVNINNVNPNNGVATLDITYETDDITKGRVELWIASGGVSVKHGHLTYDMDSELHRVPLVMDTPTIFVWGKTKRATYKQQDVELKIDQRSQGYFYPFDRYLIEFSFAVIDESQKTLRPTLWFELEDPRFVHAAPRPMLSHGEKVVVVPDSLKVTLDRPIYQRIFLGLTMLTGLGCVVWSLYKITYTAVDAMESLSLLAFDFTVLLAVPALRGVFVPSNVQFAPLFDFFVVLIWTVGLLALVMNVVRHDIVIRIRHWTARHHDADQMPFDAYGDEALNPVAGESNAAAPTTAPYTQRAVSSRRNAA